MDATPEASTTLKAKKRTWLTPSQRTRLFELWCGGRSHAEISRALGIKSHTVAAVLHRAGGIASPSARGHLALTEQEREDIHGGVASGMSMRAIARQLGRAPSTICREIKRNYGQARYRPSSAERRAWIKARRPKVCKLATNQPLRDEVVRLLRENLSPQQIAMRLRQGIDGSPPMMISHETIYRTLFLQARGALKKELCAHLRSGRKRRRPQRESRTGTASVVDGISISQRPAEVADRAVPGHWEGDLIFGNVNSYIATLVERTTRLCMLVKVSSKETAHVTAAIQQHITTLPKHLRKSLTWDRGSEMAGHKAFTIATDIPVYFCDPRSPWQRGSNENTNGLLRQYFPKGEDVSHVSQAQLDKVAAQLNRRPRQTLNWRTPAEVFHDLLP